MDVIAYGIPVMDLLINIDHGLAPNESIDINQTSWQYGGKVSTGLVATKLLCDCECGTALIFLICAMRRIRIHNFAYAFPFYRIARATLW